MFRASWPLAGIAILLLPGIRIGPQSARAAAMAAGQGSTGEIAGKILFEGAPPKLSVIQMDQDPVCAAKHAEPVTVEDGRVNSNGTLPNVFVYIAEGIQDVSPPSTPVILDQHGCIYEPHV